MRFLRAFLVKFFLYGQNDTFSHGQNDKNLPVLIAKHDSSLLSKFFYVFNSGASCLQPPNSSYSFTSLEIYVIFTPKSKFINFYKNRKIPKFKQINSYLMKYVLTAFVKNT